MDGQTAFRKVASKWFLKQKKVEKVRLHILFLPEEVLVENPEILVEEVLRAFNSPRRPTSPIIIVHKT
ncbi:MAG: hypothetical protein ACE5IJ_07115 [Thermoplasmata archaeon]